MATETTINVNKDMRLGNGKYMRHIPSGRVYPYEENGAKRDDVELFTHSPKGDTKIAKPAKPKASGPFRRSVADNLESAGDRILDVVTE